RRRGRHGARDDGGPVGRFENTHGRPSPRRSGGRSRVSAVYLYDDATARNFEPFASTRPVSELVAGTALIRERWRQAMQPRDGMFFMAGERHSDFDEPGAGAAPGGIPARAVIVHNPFLPPIAA